MHKKYEDLTFQEECFVEYEKHRKVEELEESE